MVRVLTRWDHDMRRTENTSQSLLAFLMRPGHYPRSNNYKSNARKDNLKCSLCRVMTVIMVEMILRERTPNPGPCAAQCCHLGADISIVPVMDNDSYYAASMTTNDSHSPRYQWSQWRSQNIDDQEPMTFNSLPDPWSATMMFVQGTPGDNPANCGTRFWFDHWLDIKVPTDDWRLSKLMISKQRLL